jgi:hypothetical protein
MMVRAAPRDNGAALFMVPAVIDGTATSWRLIGPGGRGEKTGAKGLQSARGRS